MHKHESPLGSRLALAFIASIMSAGAYASVGEEPGQPKLVIGIMVDELQEEYITQLRQHFTNGGFNRLLNSGVVLSNVDYGTPIDLAAATAMIYTGASPALTGISSEEIYDRATQHGIPVFTDIQYIGNNTDQTLSPRAMLTSTITDEIRIAGDEMTYAYALAADPAQALVMAGHAANCGMWINDANFNWATTTFYKDVPRVLNDRIYMRPLSHRVDTMVWTPALSPSKYMLLPQHLTRNSFNYTFTQKGPQAIQAFKNSPMVNSEITDFAIEHINSLDLGSHDGPDMINLSYTLQPFAFSRNADNRYELIDSYYRLDRDLQRLFSVIDKKVGLPNTLIFLASAPAVQRSRRDDKKWNIPTGEFSTKKAISLLNLYFIAAFGNGNWVQGFHNNQFYLNHDLIKTNGLDLRQMRQEAAAFLVQMAGVGAAYSLDDIIYNRAGLHSATLKLNTNISHAGDILIKVLPGWELLDDYNNPTVKPNQVARDNAAVAPAIIMAPGLAPHTIGTAVDARSIAPTVCRLLRIRSPNAASLPPLDLTK